MMAEAYMPKAKTEVWATPQYLFDRLDLEFGFTVDAAALPDNAKCERYWTPETDGLSQSWYEETVFCNPPYGSLALQQWTEKAWLETREPKTTAVMVVPVKSDQYWWHHYAMASEIRFIRGRVNFGDADSSYPGGIAILVFGRRIWPCMKTYRIRRRK